MLGDQLTGFDLSSAIMLPGWVLAALAALVVLVCTGVALRSGTGLRHSVPVAVAFLIAITAAWLVDHLAGRDLATERSAIEARAFELRMHALGQGSALACLEPTAGDMVQESCEKALFISPETAAAAVSYVTAQVSLLAATRKHAEASGLNYFKLMTPLRRTIEADRFGMVAHLFAAHGCGSDECDLFALLQDATRVKTNLAENAFEAKVKTHMADWQNAGSRQPPGNSSAASATAASAAPASSAPVAITVTKPPSNAFFPSASSIPAVNIMVPEPTGGAQQSREAAASARRSAQGATPVARTEMRQPALPGQGSAPAPESRHPPAAETRQEATAQPRQQSTVDNGQARSGPLQLVPPPQ
jgi:hypothetical protein